MRLLSSALYCEGPSDALFLRPLFRRLCEATAAHAHEPVAERVQPAIDRLAGELEANRRVVAVVPVRSTEAWLLADLGALRQVLGTTLGDEALGLSHLLAHGAERVTDPKALLRQAITAAKPRARAAQVAAYRASLGEIASFERLRLLGAFRMLEQDFRAALLELSILQAGS